MKAIGFIARGLSGVVGRYFHDHLIETGAISGRAVYSQKVQDAAIDLKRELAPIFRACFPGDSGCRHCLLPFAIVGNEVFPFDRYGGFFVVCPSCWSRLRHTDGGVLAVRTYAYELAMAWAAPPEPCDPNDVIEKMSGAIDRALVHWPGVQ